jgi:hypothetical protein
MSQHPDVGERAHLDVEAGLAGSVGFTRTMREV